MSQAQLIPSPLVSRRCPPEILRCPITGAPLREMTSAELDALNSRIQRGEVRHVDGSLADASVQGAYCCLQQSFAYRVDQGIIGLLPSLGLVLDESQRRQASGLRTDKRAVQRFYDQIGWQTADGGEFVDAQRWEDLRPVSASYIHRCHGRVKQHLPAHGKYLLDVASGPVQYSEYLTYSESYEARICVDLSFTALRQAQRKLGDRGIYILGDITNLPLQDEVIDAAISLHTIYHVPADEQASAFREVARVLNPRGCAVVVYNWRSLAVKLALLPARTVQSPLKLIRKLLARFAGRDAQQPGKPPSDSAVGELYFHAHSHRWFVRQPWNFDYEIRTWRSASIPLLRSYVHGWLLGRAVLALLYRLEETFPQMFGRWGAYPLIVIRK